MDLLISEIFIQNIINVDLSTLINIRHFSVKYYHFGPIHRIECDWGMLERQVEEEIINVLKLKIIQRANEK